MQTKPRDWSLRREWNENNGSKQVKIGDMPVDSALDCKISATTCKKTRPNRRQCMQWKACNPNMNDQSRVYHHYAVQGKKRKHFSVAEIASQLLTLSAPILRGEPMVQVEITTKDPQTQQKESVTLPLSVETLRKGLAEQVGITQANEIISHQDTLQLTAEQNKQPVQIDIQVQSPPKVAKQNFPPPIQTLQQPQPQPPMIRITIPKIDWKVRTALDPQKQADNLRMWDITLTRLRFISDMVNQRRDDIYTVLEFTTFVPSPGHEFQFTIETEFENGKPPPFGLASQKTPLKPLKINNQCTIYYYIEYYPGFVYDSPAIKKIMETHVEQKIILEMDKEYAALKNNAKSDHPF